MPSSSRDSDSSFSGEFASGETLIGRYRIVALVGEGGMGQVYLADDLVLGEPVAVKFLPPHLAEDENALERFRAEVRNAREVTHPNVARVHDIGEVDGRHFLTMEFVDGEDLASVARRIGRLPSEKASQVAQQICSALSEAHRRGVLHRDLKPANVMLDGEGNVKLTDFGLAVTIADSADAGIAGTPRYLAPELLSGVPATVASEVYSLGLVLHELYTGKPALSGKRVEELRREHEEGGPLSSSSALADLDPEVASALSKCLSRDPADRPASVMEVAHALPGGDPLAAALAAGETPSPDLVARSSAGGGLAPRAVVAAVVATVLLLLTLATYNRSSLVYPDTSPARLEFLAEEILVQLGYEDLPQNNAGGINVNRNVFSKEVAGELEGELDEDGGWPPLYRYWRRWSPGSLLPADFHAPGYVGIDDPLQFLPGSATVALDTTGRLLSLSIVPRVGAPGSAEGAGFDSLFRRAGLDPESVVEKPGPSPLPIHCDEARTFIGEFDGQSVEIRTGTLRGVPIHFELIMEDGGFPPPTLQTDAFAGIWFTLTFCGIVFCLRNLRRGRGDLRSANRYAALMFLVYLAIELLAVRLPEQSLLSVLNGLVFGRAGGHALIHSVHVWVMYLAIEPYLRGTWPRMLVAWVRLLDGGWRDSAVGREILIGCLCGVAVGTLHPLSHELLSFLGVPNLSTNAAGIFGLRSAVAFQNEVLSSLSRPMLATMEVAILLVVTHLAVRRTWAMYVAAGAFIGFFQTTMVTYYGAPLPQWSMATMMAAGVASALVFKYGLLAGFVGLVIRDLLCMSMVSTDLGAWHAPYSLAVFALVLVPTAYAAVIAVDTTGHPKEDRRRLPDAPHVPH